MSATLALIATSLVLLLAALPGVVVASSRREPLALGACLSLGAHSLLLSYLPLAGGVWLLAADFVLVLVLVLVLGLPRHRPRPLELLVVLLVSASFAALTLHHQAPRGWDPSFHCLLVDRLALGERPLTWEPWEPVPVHYTLGADALVAHVVRATGLEPHQAFEHSFPFAYALVAWSALGAFRRATRSRLAALHGALALGLLAGEIRLVYHWGGLPTVLGLALALGAAEARSWLAAGLLLGTLPHFHHLTALIAWSVALLLAVALRSKPIVKALGVATLLALPLVPQVHAALHDAGSTSIFRFADEPRRSLQQYVWHPGHWGWGPGLLFLAALGLVGMRRAPPQPPPADRGGARLCLLVFAFLALVHVGLDVVYRETAIKFWGADFTALTPSRWFQLASVPLAALAALGVARAVPRQPRAALLGVVGVVALSVPFASWETERGLDPELFHVGAWARARLPEDAFVVVSPRLPSHYWWPYLLRRETDETPLPASEPRRDPRVLAKAGLATDPAAARAHASGRRKRLFWLVPASASPVPGAKRLDVYRGLVALDEG